MMGVHGNGLTSLVWMQPSPRSTVMEFFFPGGFAHDYEWTSRALGMVHYGFWNDQYVATACRMNIADHTLADPSQVLTFQRSATLPVSREMKFL